VGLRLCLMARWVDVHGAFVEAAAGFSVRMTRLVMPAARSWSTAIFTSEYAHRVGVHVEFLVGGIFCGVAEAGSQLFDANSGLIRTTGTTEEEFAVPSDCQMYGVFAEGVRMCGGIAGVWPVDCDDAMCVIGR
jgi:hypothetical protein